MPFENSLPRLYSTFASWFHLLTSPADYSEEAEFARQALVSGSDRPIHTVLELGSGGGNNAFHLKQHFDMTLVDFSPEMLALSRGINGECNHIVGDMRSVRLRRQFDAVFIHDAIMYMLTLEDLHQSLETAFEHCKPRGAAIIMPDFVKETFVSGVHHGGHDAEGRGLRYLQWTSDQDPADTTYTVDFAYMLREGGSGVRVEHDSHVFGLFSRDQWLETLRSVGFEPKVVLDPYGREVFASRRDDL